MPTHFIEGHAIVSAEGAIADADGRMPESLFVDADQARFQARLDASALTVLGRLGHLANPNLRRRRRLVFSRAGRGLERLDALTHRLNPDDVAIADALARLVPEGGRIAVVGGTGVFDAFLRHGYDAFHLVVAGRARIAAGRPVFTGVGSAAEAGARLLAAGLGPGPGEVLDAGAEVVHTPYLRDPGGG